MKIRLCLHSISFPNSTKHEIVNAVDQANRKVGTRLDFKGTDAQYELKDKLITLIAQSDFQLKQMAEIVKLKLAKRGVGIACMKAEAPTVLTGSYDRRRNNSVG